MFTQTNKSTTGSTLGNYQTKNDLHFIDVIRFISMIGIISYHSLILPDNISLNSFLRQSSHPEVFITLINLLRFSVICFCLISGYLIGTKIETDKFKFYSQRFKVTFLPFVVAYVVATIVFFIKKIIFHKTWELADLKDLIFESPFWFIPSQLISILLLLVLTAVVSRKYLALILVPLLIIFTIKFVYFDKRHHMDFLASILLMFYYWLGTEFKRRDWVTVIKRASLTPIIFAWLLTYFLVNLETWYLWKSDYPNIFNNLKLSAQLYSIASFILLIRVSSYCKKFSIINPRMESYGLYLYHFPIYLLTYSLMHKFVKSFHLSLSIPFCIRLFIFCFYTF